MQCKRVVVAANGYAGALVPGLADKIRPVRPSTSPIHSRLSAIVTCDLGPPIHEQQMWTVLASGEVSEYVHRDTMMDTSRACWVSGDRVGGEWW